MKKIILVLLLLAILAFYISSITPTPSNGSDSSQQTVIVEGYVNSRSKRGTGSGLPEAWWTQVDGVNYRVDEATYNNTIPGDIVGLMKVGSTYHLVYEK